MNNVNEEITYWLLYIKNRMREMKLDAEDVFMNGNCGNLYELFAKIFKGKTIPHRIYYRNEPMHILTEIEGKLYDINGETNIEKYCEYLNKHNIGIFKPKDFSEVVIDDSKVQRQCNKYRYDEEFEESETDNEMKKLYRDIEYKLNAAKEYTEKNK